MQQSPSSPDALHERRRHGIMQCIIEGIQHCVPQEHLALYRLVRSRQPSAPFSSNANGIFIPLKNLRTDVLEDCYRLVQHGIAQDNKERLRMKKQRKIMKALT